MFRRADDRGVAGFLLKDALAKTVIDAVRRVARGQRGHGPAGRSATPPRGVTGIVGISATRLNRRPARPLVRWPPAASTRAVRLARPLPARPVTVGDSMLPSLPICSRSRPAVAVISMAQW